MFRKIAAILICTFTVAQSMISLTFAQDATATDQQAQQVQIQQGLPEMPRDEIPQGTQPTRDGQMQYDTTQAPGGGRGGRGPEGFGGGQGSMPQPRDMQNMQSLESYTQIQEQQPTSTNMFVDFVYNYSTVLIAFILLALAFIFVIFYKRSTF